MPSGSAQTESRAPGTPSFWMVSVMSALVAHSMNFHAADWWEDSALTPSAQDGTLYGLDPSTPEGIGANPTVSETFDFAGSVAFL